MTSEIFKKIQDRTFFTATVLRDINSDRVNDFGRQF